MITQTHPQPEDNLWKDTMPSKKKTEKAVVVYRETDLDNKYNETLAFLKIEESIRGKERL